MTKRDYDNSSRTQLKKDNREAVIQVMVDAMAEGIEDMSVADIADRSGLSLRAVYGYFPDKAARISAINDWIDSRNDIHDVLPTSFAGIGEYIERTVKYMFVNETIARAQMAKGFAKDVRSHRKQVHYRRLQKVLSEKFKDQQVVSELAALITSTVRAEVAFDLRDIYGLPEAQVMSRIRKIVSLLIDDYIHSTKP